MLPPAEAPAHTEGYEGFYHLTDMQRQRGTGRIGATSSATIPAPGSRSGRPTSSGVAEYLNAKYGAGTVECEVKDSYYNMREIMEQHMDVVEPGRCRPIARLRH